MNTIGNILKILLVFALLSGCAPYNVRKSVNRNKQPDLEKAYIAGKFIHNYTESFAKMYVKIKNINNNESSFIIKLIKPPSSPIKLLEVEPGLYRLESFVKLTASGGIIKEDKISSEQTVPFKVNPGYITYIGNFEAKSFVKSKSFLPASITSSHQVSINIDSIASMQKELFVEYSEYNQLPIVAIAISAFVVKGEIQTL